MAKTITKLTPDQETLLVEHREKWRRIGLCCDPADFGTGDEVIRGFYRRLAKPEPMILHFSSPAMCELAVNYVFALLKDGGSRQLGSQLYSQLYSQLDKLSPYFINNRWGSQHWCAWEAFYLFGHEIGVAYNTEDMSLLQEWGRLSESIGWWAPWDGICFVSDRPRRVSFDQNRLLHCETAQAVEYSDGWGVYAWHGLRIPEKFITERDAITYTQITNEENVEFRRVLRDLYGRDRYLGDIGAIEIHRDEYGVLWRGEDGGDEPLMFVEVENATIEHGARRKFHLRVPPTMRTAHEAVAWTFHKTPATYHPQSEA